MTSWPKKLVQALCNLGLKYDLKGKLAGKWQIDRKLMFMKIYVYEVMHMVWISSIN